ncbi:hypothetical protein TNCV_4182161 [Trichonephila clavipes]|nr:hypothetical protein TNCV_4182161 [Trichonephila clavipes]
MAKLRSRMSKKRGFNRNRYTIGATISGNDKTSEPSTTKSSSSQKSESSHKNEKAVSNFKLRDKSIPVKHQLFDISGDPHVTKTIARLRTCHYKGMKNNRDGRRTYRDCDNSSHIELTPAYIFDCPAFLTALQK